MKKSVILLSSVLFLGLASCRTKKSQTTTSSSTTSTNTNTAYNTSEPKAVNESGSATVITPSNPKTATSSENVSPSSSNPKGGNISSSESTNSSSVSNPKSGSVKSESSTSASTSNPKSGSVKAESTNPSASNPKSVTEFETTVTPTTTTPTKNSKTATESESTQPIVYNTVTDQNCAAEVAFGSPGSGIDGDALDKVTKLLDGKSIKYTTKTFGREGERRICMPLTEVKAAEKKELLDQLKKIAKEGQYVSLSIR